jgi:hypothetical protein
LWPCRAGAKRLSIPASVKDADALPFHLLEKQPAEHQTATQWRWLLEMTRTQWSLPVTLNASPPQVVNIRTHTHNIYICIFYVYIYMYVYIVYLNRPSRHIVATKVGFFSQVCCEAKFEKGYKGPSLNKVCVPWTQRRWWGKMVVLYGFIRDRIVGNNGGLIMQ